jgi:hypothetical protein
LKQGGCVASEKVFMSASQFFLIEKKESRQRHAGWF